MQYYNGFYYDVNQPRGYYRRVQIYDAARTVVHSETRANWSYGEAERYAIDYIDQQNTGDIGDIEYDDLPVRPVTPIDPITDPVFKVHPMYDCETGTKYMAYTQEDHERYAALGYVHDLSECELPPNGGSNGDNSLLETAGVFVVGVAKGTLIAVVPITAMSVAVGFMRRNVRFGGGLFS